MFGSSKALSCMQTFMMRVASLDHPTCIQYVNQVAVGTCVDDWDWQDSAGDDCARYHANRWCENRGYGPGWAAARNTYGAFEDWADKDGTDAMQACCECSTYHSPCELTIDAAAITSVQNLLPLFVMQHRRWRAGFLASASARKLTHHIDPVCWVYNENTLQFEVFGRGSEVGLLWM